MPFTGEACQLVMFPTLKNWILAASPNVSLLDEVGNVVKSFTLTSDDITIYQSGATAIISVHISDETNDAYSFKRVQVFGQNPEGGSTITVIDHLLDQTYNKTADKTLDVYIYTGIQNVI